MPLTVTFRVSGGLSVSAHVKHERIFTRLIR